MTDIPDDWILLEAAKRCGWDYHIAFLRDLYRDSSCMRALCDMIAKHEQPPVDRKLLCAREAWEQWQQQEYAEDEWFGVRAIELYLEGFGE